MRLKPKHILKAFKESPVDYWSSFIRMYFFYRLPRLAEWYQARLLRRWQKVKPSGNLSALRSCYVTSIPNVRVGIGHTLSESITGRIWAQKTGVTYVHCSLLEPWESLLHFKGGAPTLRKLKKSRIKIYKMPRMSSRPEELDMEIIKQKWARLAQEEPVCFVLGDGQNAYDIAYPSKELRRLYRSHPEFEKRLDLRVHSKINVSIHVRRRNKVDMLNTAVHDENSEAFKARYLNSDYFLSLCQIIEEALGPDCVQFNLFSQGKPAAFENFQGLKNLRLYLDTDPCETFHNLTLSDILILSPSSFSFKAGMICPGLKLAKHPWWHEIPVDPEWIRVGEQPSAQRSALIDKIQMPFKKDNTL